MDAGELREMIARWRRYASHTKDRPGQLTPSDVYELCADELEARLRTQAPEEVKP